MQVRTLKAGTLGQPSGMRWEGRWEGGQDGGTHVHLWLIHVNVWEKSSQYYKLMILQLKQINNFFLKHKHHFANKGPYSQGIVVIVWMRELDHKEV